MDVPSENGETLLHLSIDGNAVYFAMKLIEKYNFSVDTKDNNGQTPLAKAASLGQRDLAEVLIARGADMNAVDEEGVSILMKATRHGHKSCLELLVKKGVDVNALISAGNVLGS